eukprot:1438292-Heterocapsa_arctica.AAC.1
MGPPTPVPPSPFRPGGATPPGASPAAAPAPITPCPQCPIYAATILQLNAKVVAVEEDVDDLSMYVAGDMEKNQQLKVVISQHGSHIDHRGWELNNARIDLGKQKVLHETLEYDDKMLKSGDIFQESKFLDLQGRAAEQNNLLKKDLIACKTKAATVERNLREEHHRAATTSR